MDIQQQSISNSVLIEPNTSIWLYHEQILPYTYFMSYACALYYDNNSYNSWLLATS